MIRDLQDPTIWIDSSFTRIQPKSAYIDIVGVIRRYAIVAAVLSLPYSVFRDTEGFYGVLFGEGGPIAFGCILIYVAIRIVYLLFEVHFRAYKLDATGLHVKTGLLVKSHVIVPQSRIQYTTIDRSFLERSMDLATLRVSTAGSQLAAVTVKHLRDEEAERIRRALLPELEDE